MLQFVSFQNKIRFLIIGLVFTLSLFMVLYFPAQQQSTMKEEFYKKVEALAETVQLGISIGLASNDLAAAEKVFTYTKSDPAVSFVVIMNGAEQFSAYPAEFRYQESLMHSDTLVIAKRPLQTELINGQIIVGCRTSLISEKIHTVRLLSLLIGVGMMLVGIALAFIIANTVVRPINALGRAAKLVGEGDLSQSVEVKTNDQIGQLAESFNAMVIKIRDSASISDRNRIDLEQGERLMRTIAQNAERQREYLAVSVQTMLQSVEKLAQGDLTQSIRDVAEHDDIERMFDGYSDAVANVRRMVLKVVETVEATAQASNEISEKTEQMFSGLKKQSEQTNSVSAAMEQMIATITDNTQQASLAARQAEQARSDAARSGEVIKSMIANVGEISNVVIESAQRIRELGSSSEQIGEIVQVIEEIADQTNLLALNAAIEAARAGDQGRGFAVVADEVRKLAERTQKATKEISRTITTIQLNTEQVVMSMNKGTAIVNESGQFAANTSEALEEIIVKTDRVATIVSQLAAANEQQATTSNEVSKSLNIIVNEVTVQTALSISEIAITAAELGSLTENLQTLMRQFNVIPSSNQSAVTTTNLALRSR